VRRTGRTLIVANWLGVLDDVERLAKVSSGLGFGCVRRTLPKTSFSALVRKSAGLAAPWRYSKVTKGTRVEPDDIEQGLIADAHDIALEGKAGWADREWTRRLLARFAERGHKLGYSVCGSGNAQFGRGEWLYDLVWLKRGVEPPKHIFNIPLILESEWNKFDWILEDFEKLLVGRAQHRAMVFQAGSPEKVSALIGKLTDLVATSELTQAGDRYLFLGLDNPSTIFFPETWAFY
jgi:hypothetical protein